MQYGPTSFWCFVGGSLFGPPCCICWSTVVELCYSWIRDCRSSLSHTGCFESNCRDGGTCIGRIFVLLWELFSQICRSRISVRLSQSFGKICFVCVKKIGFTNEQRRIWWFSARRETFKLRHIISTFFGIRLIVQNIIQCSCLWLPISRVFLYVVVNILYKWLYSES